MPLPAPEDLRIRRLQLAEHKTSQGWQVATAACCRPIGETWIRSRTLRGASASTCAAALSPVRGRRTAAQKRLALLAMRTPCTGSVGDVARVPSERTGPQARGVVREPALTCYEAVPDLGTHADGCGRSLGCRRARDRHGLALGRWREHENVSVMRVAIRSHHARPPGAADGPTAGRRVALRPLWVPGPGIGARHRYPVASAGFPALSTSTK